MPVPPLPVIPTTSCLILFRRTASCKSCQNLDDVAENIWPGYKSLLSVSSGGREREGQRWRSWQPAGRGETQPCCSPHLSVCFCLSCYRRPGAMWAAGWGLRVPPKIGGGAGWRPRQRHAPRPRPAAPTRPDPLPPTPPPPSSPPPGNARAKQTPENAARIPQSLSLNARNVSEICLNFSGVGGMDIGRWPGSRTFCYTNLPT